MTISRGRPDDDLTALQVLESEGDQLFVAAGVPGSDRWTPTPIGELRDSAADGGLWVAEDRQGVVGFARVTVVDGHAHLEQLSVGARSMRRGIGSALLEVVCSEVATNSGDEITLTTYAAVPWNAPFYERRGFRLVDPAEWTPSLRKLRRHEAAIGLDTAPRVVMRRVLSGAEAQQCD